jgi:hypothetical protein
MAIVLFHSLLISATATAEVRQPRILADDPGAITRTEYAFRKCMKKATHIRDERVCDSIKPALRVCMRTELSFSSGKKAQATCEHLFVM